MENERKLFDSISLDEAISTAVVQFMNQRDLKTPIQVRELDSVTKVVENMIGINDTAVLEGARDRILNEIGRSFFVNSDSIVYQVTQKILLPCSNVHQPADSTSK